MGRRVLLGGFHRVVSHHDQSRQDLDELERLEEALRSGNLDSVVEEAPRGEAQGEVQGGGKEEAKEGVLV